MTDRELMQQALLKMEYMLNNGEWYKPEETIEALRARLAQPEQEQVRDAIVYGTGITKDGERIDPASIYKEPEQEPVFAFRRKGLDDFCTCSEDRYNELAQKPNLFEVKKFYTTPPQREWHSITVPDIRKMWDRIPPHASSYIDFARAIEAKLKEKNT